MDFLKDFIEGAEKFKKQCKIDGDTGEAQIERNIADAHKKQDEAYKKKCAVGAFVRMTLGFAPDEKRKEIEALLDVGDAIRDIQYEMNVLARVGEVLNPSKAEVEKLCSVRDYLQLVLVGMWQFASELDGGTDE